MPAHSLCCSEPEFPPKQTSGFYSVDWPLAVYAPVSGVRVVMCSAIGSSGRGNGVSAGEILQSSGCVGGL